VRRQMVLRAITGRPATSDAAVWGVFEARRREKPLNSRGQRRDAGFIGEGQ